ncbi:AcidPPc domain-containing protein [Aphelenchoides fujianensis]|nr:AcidPPc domain-containing protein [Aphelenchoides fujianensis]
MISRHAVSTLLSLPILIVLKFFAEAVPYTRQGFFCDDDDIRMPYRENTVPSRPMAVLFAISACVLFVAGEYSLIRHLTRKGRRVRMEDGKVHPLIDSVFFLIASYLCSALATTISTTFAKRTICRLRPNFLAVCQPNLTQLCTPHSHVFIEDYECLGRFDDDEFYSFPSGHSSSAANFAVFMIVYLQKRCKFHEVVRAVPPVRHLPVRHFLRDYRHRLSDVAGGALLGGLFAVYFVTHVLRNFKSHRYEVEADEAADAENGNRFKYLRLPTIVVDEKRLESSEYGSLDGRPLPTLHFPRHVIEFPPINRSDENF